MPLDPAGCRAPLTPPRMCPATPRLRAPQAVCGGYSVDLALPLHKVALEADGPSHMLDDFLELTGPTLMKHRHLQVRLRSGVRSGRYGT